MINNIQSCEYMFYWYAAVQLAVCDYVWEE